MRAETWLEKFRRLGKEKDFAGMTAMLRAPQTVMAALGAVHGEQNDQARMNSKSLLPKEVEK